MTARLALALALVAAAAPALASPAPKPKPRIVVNRPQGERIPDAVVNLLDGLILSEVQKSGRFSHVVGSSDIAAVIRHGKELQQCGAETDACLAEIGGALDAQFLLASALGLLGTKYVVNMRVIEVATTNVSELRRQPTVGPAKRLISLGFLPCGSPDRTSQSG